MSMEHWWNDTDKIKRKYSEKTLTQCHCVQDSHSDWPGTEASSIFK